VVPPFRLRLVCRSSMDGAQLMCVPSIAPTASSKNSEIWHCQIFWLEGNSLHQAGEHRYYKMAGRLECEGLGESICNIDLVRL
jgi:hypothetical protein